MAFNSQFDNGQFKNFVTYYGDIYNGRIVRLHNDTVKNRFFILSRNQHKELERLPEVRTLENYKRLC